MTTTVKPGARDLRSLARMWIPRGLVLAVVWVVARAIVGSIVEADPGVGTLARMVGLLVVIVVAFVWAVFDGRTDRKVHPDPDHGGADLVSMWLAAGVLAGLVGGGFVSWLVGLTGIEMGDNSLLIEMIAAAPWLLLLVFAGGVAGCAVGARIAERGAPAYTGRRTVVMGEE